MDWPGTAPGSQRKSDQPSYSNFVIFHQEDQFEENDARLVSSCHNRLRGLWGSTAVNYASASWEIIRTIL